MNELNNRKLKTGLLAALVALVILTAVSVAAGLSLAPVAKRKIVEYMRESYESDVEIGSLTVTLFPSLNATGENIKFFHHGRRDVPPLITLRRFQAQAGWLNVLWAPRRVHRVTLEGLEIRVPSKSDREQSSSDDLKGSRKKGIEAVLIDQMTADGALLQILPSEPDKDPLEFDIYKLTIQNVTGDRPMSYQAQLRNAKPPGLIDANGQFGPWASAEPGTTPVEGKYRFENADLGVFKGISGKLSSTGRFEGALNRIEVEGETDTPDFAVRTSGNPVHLKTTFSATVDGTNGDTYLHPVTAHFLQSTVVASGGIESKAKGQGKTITLNATLDSGRIEDLVHLAVSGKDAVMKGNVQFKTKLTIPPGDVDVVEKIDLNGQFGIEGARFTDPETQQKVSGLSHRAKGAPQASTGPVASNLNGRFVVDNGVIRLTGLQFTVPGARIHLNGTYGLNSEKLDFQGTAKLDATVSEMTSGWKSVFLKVIDPIFKRKDAGAVIPIRIKGTRENPDFGLDLTL